MLPDQRLTTMLETAEEQFGADPQFLDGLFERLIAERDTRPAFRAARRLPAPARVLAALAAAVIVIAVLGSVALQRQPPGPAASPSPSVAPSASASRSPSGSPRPSVVPLAAEQLDWCRAHTNGTGSDQHQVEDMALFLDLIPSTTSRAEVLSHWDLQSPDALAAEPSFVSACRAAYVTLSSAAPSTASIDPLTASIKTGMTEFDHAVTAARGPLGISDADQTRLFQLEDAINARLDARDLTGARTNLNLVIDYLSGIADRLDTDGGRRLQAAVDALDALVPAG